MLSRLMGRLFTSKTKRKPRKATPVQPTVPTQGMVALTITYGSYVLPAAKALQLMNLMAKAEIYESVYHSDMVGDYNEKHTHHIYAQDREIGMKLLPDAYYGMCKLAGKPEKKK